MAKTYFLRFGEGDPRTYTGLTPTLAVFKLSDGTNITAPALAEVTSMGVWSFSYGTTVPIAFLADAFTTGLGLGTVGRYVMGSIDPADRADEYGNTLVAIGTTNLAVGTSNLAISVTILAISTTMSSLLGGIGTAGSTFGGLSTDPIDLFGYAKRVIENLEGNQTFLKGSGALAILSRGSSTTLANKTITNSISTVIKT